MNQNRKIIYADDLLVAIRDDYNINSSAFAAMVRHIHDAPAVTVAPVLSISDAATTALERMGANAHGGETPELIYGSTPCVNLPKSKPHNNHGGG